MNINKAPRNRTVFFAIVVLWFLLDRITKGIFESLPIGARMGEAIGPILEFRLVHNYGAAWGSFSGFVIALIVVTAILCIAILVYAMWTSRHAPLLEMVGLALIFAGGIGNLFDRIFNGYVIDFIAPLFIDFPTFNIADIGVTCGIVLVIMSVVVQLITSRNKGYRPEETIREDR